MQPGVLLQRFECEQQRIGIAVAAAVQADIHLETEAQIDLQIVGQRTIGREPLVGIDQPDDPRSCAARIDERALGQRVPRGAHRHRLSEQQVGGWKRFCNGNADRQMKSHDEVGLQCRPDVVQQRQARQRFVDNADLQPRGQPGFDARNIGVQPIEIEHQTRLVNPGGAQGFRQLRKIRITHPGSTPRSRAI